MLDPLHLCPLPLVALGSHMVGSCVMYPLSGIHSLVVMLPPDAPRWASGGLIGGRHVPLESHLGVLSWHVRMRRSLGCGASDGPGAFALRGLENYALLE